MTKTQKWGLGLGLVFLFLIAIRIALPYAICALINHQLKKAEEYTGHVQDVSLQILRGGMSVEGIHFQLMSDEMQPIPSMDIQKIDMHVEGRALLKGQLRMRVVLYAPQVNFIQTQKLPPTVEGKPTEIWQGLRSVILPIPIEEVVVHQGSVHYVDRTVPNPYDIYAEHIEASLTGVQQEPTKNNPLPAQLLVQGQTVGDGQMDIHLAFNPYARLPTFKLEAQEEHLKLNQINPILAPYTDLRITQGQFDLYVEASAKNGAITGYAKPFLQNVKTTVPEHKKPNPFKRMYKSIVNWLSDVLSNNQTQKVATKAEFEGHINDPSTSLWSTIIELLRNAFIRALLPGLEHSHQ